jgi:FtsH-binding integral membrane protein
MIVNVFWASSSLYWLTTAAGIVIFCGLTAYDVQKVKDYNRLGNAGTDEDKKEAIWGAIALYLDFVNLFLFLLRIFGNTRD